MLTLRLGRVLGEMLRKYTRLGYVRASDYAYEELGVGERTVRNYARLAEGLLGRPILRAAYLERRLEMSHILILLHMPAAEDAEWVARAVGMGTRELRAALKSRLPEAALQEREEMAVLELDLRPDAFVDWLNTRELACRLDGQDLVPAAVLERVVANFVAEAALPEQEPAPFLLPTQRPAPLLPPTQEPATCRPSAHAEAPAPAAKAHPTGCACCRGGAPEAVDGEPAERIPAELTALLPHDPRKLAVLARELMQAREASELLQDLILDRMRRDRLYRDLGHRSFRDYGETLGFAGSTAYLLTSRSRLLEVHPILQRAVLEGRLSRSKVDALQPLAGFADLPAWVEYARDRTCRRLRAAVEVCMSMRAKAPAAWARRGKLPPQEGESLDDLREQAGLATLEASLDELQRRLEEVQTSSGGGGVQTFSGTTTGVGGGVQTFSSTAPGVDGGVQTCSSTTAGGGGGVQTFSSTDTPTLRVRIVYPRSLKPLLQAGHEAACRVAGRELTPEESFHRFVLLFQLSEEEPDSAARGDKLKALERAGWQCEVPGCRGRCNLQVHHIEYRSQGGRDELPNYVVLCAAHHLRHVHEGRMKVEGEDPLTRFWEVGILDGVPYRTYVDERLVDAWEWDQQDDERPDRVSEAVVAYRVEAELPRAA